MRVRLVVVASLLGCAPEVMDPPVYIPADVRGPTVIVLQQPAPPPVTPVPDQAMLGDWDGVGFQSGNLQWSFVLHLTDTHDRCAEVQYPSVPCTAYWTCEGVVNGELRAVEHLTTGQNVCVDGGHVAMHLRADGRLDWRFENEPGDVSATAVLSRSR